ncbi:hypothetical protein Trydic_g4837 [Trypoxylus dichotomus]
MTTGRINQGTSKSYSLERDVVVTSQPIYATKRTESNTPSASRTDRTTDIQSLSSNIIIEQRCPFVRNAVQQSFGGREPHASTDCTRAHWHYLTGSAARPFSPEELDIPTGRISEGLVSHVQLRTYSRTYIDTSKASCRRGRSGRRNGQESNRRASEQFSLGGRARDHILCASTGHSGTLTKANRRPPLAAVADMRYKQHVHSERLSIGTLKCQMIIVVEDVVCVHMCMLRRSASLYTISVQPRIACLNDDIVDETAFRPEKVGAVDMRTLKCI